MTTVVHWHVAPRYTAGSPAMVNQQIARRVARQEQDAITWILDGCSGEDARVNAMRLGLRDIACGRQWKNRVR